jgi:hypothetical protein
MAFKKGHKPSNGFDKDPERARAAGRKSQTATADLRAARRMAALEFEDIVYKYMRSPVDELKRMMTDPKTPAVELVVIKLLVMSIQNGDISRFNLLLERTIGKVQEKIKLEGNMTTRTLHDQIVDEIEKNELTNS